MRKNIDLISRGELHMGLTGVRHFLLWHAGQQHRSSPPGRFGWVAHQRTPLCAAVRDDSSIRTLAQLQHARMAQCTSPGMGLVTKEFVAAVKARELDSPTLVPVEQLDLVPSLVEGRVDALATQADTVPDLERSTGLGLRTLITEVEAYSVGLLVRDDVSTAMVEAVRAALTSAIEQLQGDPSRAIEALVASFPDADPCTVERSWLTLADKLDGPNGAGQMVRSQWEHTITWLSGVHNLEPPEVDQIYREDLVCDERGKRHGPPPPGSWYRGDVTLPR